MKRKREEKQDRSKFVIKPHQKKKKLQFSETDTISSKLDSVPLDLKLDILSRLPAKSLISLRCVSKMWSSIIRSPTFIDSFFSISSTRPRLILALSNENNHPEESLVFFFSFSADEKSSSLVPTFDMAIPSFVTFASLTGTCTSVPGFLAVQLGHLTLCNPCTEQFIKFPHGTNFVGYDPIHHQYKALFFNTRLECRNGVAVAHLDHKVLTLGEGGGGWRHLEPPITTPYTPMYTGVSIHGFIYYAAFAPTRPSNPGIVCFDVTSEKLTYIKAPEAALFYCGDTTLIEYKGKLAIIVFDPYGRFNRFDLWVLEDVQKHEWSNHRCLLPPRVWDYVGGWKLSCPGTNKAGEIIMAPTMLPRHVQPFYIFYYNVETHNIRRVRLLGIGDNREFRRSYGFADKRDYRVFMSPQHIESIAFFNNPTT